MGEIILSDSNFENEVLSSAIPVVVNFWAPWCGPCRMLAPIVEKLAEEYEGRVKICKLNVEEAYTTASTYKVKSIPTIIIFKSGKIVDQSTGFLSETDFRQKIDTILE
ncbi:MAG: thioredoxin [Candidatus Stahlbacteria bacterium]|nr:thioredoxin [Candidatus Stahlbacteria bacterium]